MAPHRATPTPAAAAAAAGLPPTVHTRSQRKGGSNNKQQQQQGASADVLKLVGAVSKTAQEVRCSSIIKSAIEHVCSMLLLWYGGIWENKPGTNVMHS
jgi:hypothetical protein